MASFTAATGVSQRGAISRASSRSSVRVFAATPIPQQYQTVKPLADRVMLKVDKEETKTIGGVYIPQAAQRKPTAGSLVSVGETAYATKVGDRVLYSKFSGVELKIKGSEYVMLKEDELIGILSDNDQISRVSPLGDRVLLQCLESKSGKSTGGLLLTNDGEVSNIGTVVTLGTGYKKEGSDEIEKPKAVVGAIVMYNKYSGMELQDADGSAYIIVREGDILATLS